MEFKDIEGFEGLYMISDWGYVMSLYSNPPIIIKPSPTPNGYLKVTLSKNGIHYNKFIHRMVTDTFLGKKPEGLECINHIDGNKLNNRVDNLEWTTNSLNRKHAYAKQLHFGRLGKGKSVKITDTLTDETTVFPTRRAIERFLGFSQGWVKDTMRRRGNPFIYENYVVEVME